MANGKNRLLLISYNIILLVRSIYITSDKTMYLTHGMQTRREGGVASRVRARARAGGQSPIDPPF